MEELIDRVVRNKNIYRNTCIWVSSRERECPTENKTKKQTKAKRNMNSMRA